MEEEFYCTVLRRLCPGSEADGYYFLETRNNSGKMVESLYAPVLMPDEAHEYNLLNTLVGESQRRKVGSVTTIPARKYFSMFGWTDIPIPDEEFGVFLSEYDRIVGPRRSPQS